MIQRLNRLKAAWLEVVHKPTSRRRQLTYCWRYFGLLHHTLGIAAREPVRGDPLPVLHRILAFASFTTKADDDDERAACVFSAAHPAYVLGRLAPGAPPPAPRHVPLVLPLGETEPYYCYRQLSLSGNVGEHILVFPSSDLRRRPGSFGAIDRLARLLSVKPDPYWRPRSKLLAERILVPLYRLRGKVRTPGSRNRRLSILDIGAGTGHLSVNAWRHLRKRFSSAKSTAVALHFVDASGPSLGRSFGVSQSAADIAFVEWTSADYRGILDDDRWLQAKGPFDWVFICRLLDNASNFTIEQVPGFTGNPGGKHASCEPHRCLAPRQRPLGIERLAVRTVNRAVPGGTTMPQVALADYFRAMHAVVSGNLGPESERVPYLAVRRFNPAALTTTSGRSIVAQLMTVASAIVVEDVDLSPEHFVHHQQQFGLAGTGCVQCRQDGFATRLYQYVVAAPDVVESLQGDRLW